MVSESKRVQSIVAVFAAKGIKKIVFSPGSRNAPLVLSLANDSRFECISIVDERSAAFFALGIAIATQRPVAICCTSGSASLNYSSALSEAYYQSVPLIAITADRPPEWIHHGEGQAINQVGIFDNFTHSSYNLPISESKEDIYHTQRQLNEAIINAQQHQLPVHINIPFREPLYGKIEKVDIKVNIFDKLPLKKTLSETTLKELAKSYNAKQKVLILCGQQTKDEQLTYILEQFASLDNTVVLTESTSNLYNREFIPCIDRVITTFENKTPYEPELLITIGRAIISKKIKKFLRNVTELEHWNISPSDRIEDTYQKLSKHISITPNSFFRALFPLIEPTKIESNYKNQWKSRHILTNSSHDSFLTKVKWSDLKVFDIIYNTLPENCNLHLGNSSPVRYMQLFNQIKGITYFGNRGVSGIDGSTSTAAGIAFSNTDNLNILISGDLSFIYDNNALWNNHLTSNLRVIIINNNGGGIFRIIPGPETTNALEPFFEVGNKASIEQLTISHNVNYYKATNANELEEQFPPFYNPQTNNLPAVLEVITSSTVNDKVLKAYFEFLKK